MLRSSSEKKSRPLSGSPLDLFLLNDLVHVRLIGLQQRERAPDLHRLGDLAQLEHHVDAQSLIDDQDRWPDFLRFERRRFRLHLVPAERHVGQVIGARRVRPDSAGEARIEVRGGDRRPRQHAAALIGHRAENRSGCDLSLSRAADADTRNEENREQSCALHVNAPFSFQLPRDSPPEVSPNTHQ